MRLYFEYMAHLIHRNTTGGHKLRYYCFLANGGSAASNTQKGIKWQIKQSVEKFTTNLRKKESK